MTETRNRRLWWRHALSFLVAPVTMTVFIPALIVAWADIRLPAYDSPSTIGLLLVGCLLVAGGVGMLLWTVYLFDRVGKGTLGVGEVMGQPVNLVVHGPYRHVRNPMISGVVAILLGEAAIAASGWMLLWAATFFVMLTTFIQVWEEPHLAERFGEEYTTYRRNVPRWLPRITAWEPQASRSS
ncbi:Protein-S-isoprenylcysteine O-methyltransferase Ste14 [Mycolicibacterium rutilum]|uniref:Protein-S-isoprenylcysteine O-methyltransferase Ste14 n=1 Tax=Mycolicibacterium rutilum TaxID=370526 RepID=A0A1H6LBA4_MYCRU|nr:isoprenylcysteine carboxylmethyltransferase family protein [Mycolicibacterium rutilum]SEH85670.1 Protein-S-isoprenylcysteine O-methyltransferase Ste14 [Mycolicibacterium rutilum]